MPPHISEANTINKWLTENCGKSLDGRPIWRLSWPNNVTEKRVGPWEDWYGSIFVRRTFGLQDVPKYPYYKSRWILERLTFLPLESPVKKELVDTENGTYEPIYVFWDKDQKYLPPHLEVTKKIFHDLMNPVIVTPGDIKRDELKAQEDEMDYFKLVLADSGRSPLFVGFERKNYGGWDGRPRKTNEPIILSK